MASVDNSASISITAGTTLDVSGPNGYTLGSSTNLSASGTATTAGNYARIIGPSGGAVSLGAQGITLTWSGDTSGTDTDSPSLYVSQGELTLNNNAITINGSTLGEGTYRLIQVGNGASGTLNENVTPSYTVSGTAIDGGKTNVVSSDGSGNLILTVTPGGGSRLRHLGGHQRPPAATRMTTPTATASATRWNSCSAVLRPPMTSTSCRLLPPTAPT